MSAVLKHMATAIVSVANSSNRGLSADRGGVGMAVGKAGGALLSWVLTGWEDRA